MSESPLAVVLGMGPTGLAIARGLGRRGVDVYGVGLSRWESGLCSRYCRPIAWADPRKSPHVLYEKLLKFAADRPDRTKVIYPAGDEFVAFLSQHDEVLRRHYRYGNLRPDVAEKFLNKKAFHRFCGECGVATMRTEFPKDYDHAQSLVKELNYPVLLKPIVYHQWAPRFGLLKGFTCRDERQYARNLSRVRGVIDNVMVQEIVEGPESNLCCFIAYVDRLGRARGAFTARKIRQYPPDFGTGSAVMSHPEQQIVQPSLKLLAASGYQGLAEVEFKYCPRQKIHKALEVNIRPCRLGGLADAAGSQALWSSFLDLTGQAIPPEVPQVYGIKWLFASRDIPAVMRGLLRGRFGLRDVIGSYSRPRTWCVWAPDDMLPFWGYLLEFGAKAAGNLAHRLKGVITRSSAA